ncbi:ornithine carbamoyltransferase [Ramlibacter pallidus]|uniref:Ornithine carbamoyltransferase n=1 Tax=Ramlibacter pallidus TaxID=2780087 RepID=A0ABR9S3B6_9BURK|nr:ornithine carbamoyltransferase [Ramlibacter pallidus]MBE7367992.1 ornithine carbamoyltransferase [Ramlibacter pallidus]
MKLLRISDLRAADIEAIWSLVGGGDASLRGTIAWSFEGNGIRTRTTFIQAFRDLGLAFTELPNLLKTDERACDLAGYLDPFYDAYVVREANHARLAEFAAASRRPVVNAMSSQGHPCEVLTDAFYLHTRVAPLERARVCLWGPTTNVLRSWHELAGVLGFPLRHACDRRFHETLDKVTFTEAAILPADVVITDGWPQGADDPRWSLTEEHLARMGSPMLLPTPPFSIGRELAFDPLRYRGFAGYAQKQLLLPVHKAILRHVLSR